MTDSFIFIPESIPENKSMSSAKSANLKKNSSNCDSCSSNGKPLNRIERLLHRGTDSFREFRSPDLDDNKFRWGSNQCKSDFNPRRPQNIYIIEHLQNSAGDMDNEDSDGQTVATLLTSGKTKTYENEEREPTESMESGKYKQKLRKFRNTPNLYIIAPPFNANQQSTSEDDCLSAMEQTGKYKLALQRHRKHTATPTEITFTESIDSFFKTPLQHFRRRQQQCRPARVTVFRTQSNPRAVINKLKDLDCEVFKAKRTSSPPDIVRELQEEYFAMFQNPPPPAPNEILGIG